jgi:hypothetical protein
MKLKEKEIERHTVKVSFDFPKASMSYGVPDSNWEFF